MYVADNGVYSAPNMRRLNQAGVKWVSRVSETSTEAKEVLQYVQTQVASLTIVLRLQPLHRRILALLGPLYEKIYHPSG